MLHFFAHTSSRTVITLSMSKFERTCIQIVGDNESVDYSFGMVAESNFDPMLTPAVCLRNQNWKQAQACETLQTSIAAAAPTFGMRNTWTANKCILSKRKEKARSLDKKPACQVMDRWPKVCEFKKSSTLV